jgi:hypothetical protein
MWFMYETIPNRYGNGTIPGGDYRNVLLPEGAELPRSPSLSPLSREEISPSPSPSGDQTPRRGSQPRKILDVHCYFLSLTHLNLQKKSLERNDYARTKHKSITEPYIHHTICQLSQFSGSKQKNENPSKLYAASLQPETAKLTVQGNTWESFSCKGTAQKDAATTCAEINRSSLLSALSTRKIQRNRKEDQRSRSRGCLDLWRACAGADLGGAGGDEIHGRPPQTSSRGKRAADWRLSDGEDDGMGSGRPLGLSKGHYFYTSLWAWAIYSLLGRFCPILMRNAHEFRDYPGIGDGELGNICVPASPDGDMFWSAKLLAGSKITPFTSPNG